MPRVVKKMLGHELGGGLAVYNNQDWLDNQLEAYADRLFEAIEFKQ
ncbi:integrase [Photobacterium sp.]|nr:integrase [Photobacterium sp.]MDX1301829.1 integrase [Photobacterium sp.]